MKTQHEIDAMRETAYAEQLKAKDQRLTSPLPFASDADERYAEGVEAALLWVLGDAGSPFPR